MAGLLEKELGLLLGEDGELGVGLELRGGGTLLGEELGVPEALSSPGSSDSLSSSLSTPLLPLDEEPASGSTHGSIMVILELKKISNDATPGAGSLSVVILQISM